MEPGAQTRAEVARSTPSPVLQHTAALQHSLEVDTFLANWIVQARKGLLELSVLTALEKEEHYGYDIVRDMSARPALGGAEGTVYPMLARLEERGLLVTNTRISDQGPTRKYYNLTDDGRSALTAMRARFRELIQGVLREEDEDEAQPAESSTSGFVGGLRRLAH